MFLFIKDLSSTSLSFEVNSVAELEYQLAEKSGIPIFEQRLIFGGKQLSNQHNLLDYGLSDGNTINLALRLRGGAPKKRCGFFLDVAGIERCSSPAVRIIGECSFCSKDYCGRHRLAEDHKCPNLSTCKQDAFLKNKAKLESERMVGSKIESM